MSELEGAPNTYPPLGMPVGSVRAMLTLVVVAVVVVNIAREREIDILWMETLLIALAHYFTSRRFVVLPPAVKQRLESEGVIETERHPLFLPRHSIRTLIVGAFVGLGFYLHDKGRLWDIRSISLLGIVFAYVLGSLVRGVTTWITARRTSPPARIWADLRAVVVLAALMLVAIPEFVAVAEFPPDTVRKVALGLMLFYFGSR